MIYHILNGDALAMKFDKHIEGERVICRECLVDGPLNAASLEEFWNSRETFLTSVYEEGPAYKELVDAFRKLQHAKSDSEINLWFEHDLFCQVNMWFCIDYVTRYTPAENLFWVPPVETHFDYKWSGFGPVNTNQLRSCLERRIRFSPEDIQLGQALWAAVKENDLNAMNNLAKTVSPCFPRLNEVCTAHISRFPSKPGELGRPEQRLLELMSAGIDNFPQLFQAFTKEEGVYGFGDLQVKRLLIDYKNSKGNLLGDSGL